jgi:coenzyme PQQ precursor peptide PqqA
MAAIPKARLTRTSQPLIELIEYRALTENILMPQTEQRMQWTEPQFEEISLGCEINSYACAEI